MTPPKGILLGKLPRSNTTSSEGLKLDQDLKGNRVTPETPDMPKLLKDQDDRQESVDRESETQRGLIQISDQILDKEPRRQKQHSFFTSYK